MYTSLEFCGIESFVCLDIDSLLEFLRLCFFLINGLPPSYDLFS